MAFLASWPAVENRLLQPYWSDQFSKSNWKQYFADMARVSQKKKFQKFHVI